MPHILDRSNPPVLSSELGRTSDHPLGYDALMFVNHSSLTVQLDKLRRAIGRMCNSPDEDVQIVRQRMDERFIADTVGAPSDFAFSRLPVDSITTRLSAGDDDELLDFALWNSDRQEDVRDAIVDNLPALRDDVRERANRLYRSGLISKAGMRLYRSTIEEVLRSRTVFAIDSFDGGSMLAMTSDDGLHFSHLFEGGYEIGEPTEWFWATGFHEAGHKYRRRLAWRKGRIQLVEEFLVEHHAVISGPDESRLGDSVLQATSYGGYNKLRKLFGLALLGPQTVNAELLGAALVTPASDVAYQGLLAVLGNNFAHLYPKLGNDAFRIFLDECRNCRFSHQTSAVMSKWIQEAEIKVAAA